MFAIQVLIFRRLHILNQLESEVSTIVYCTLYDCTIFFKIFRFVSTSFENAQVLAIGWDTNIIIPSTSEVQSVSSTVLNQSSCKIKYPFETSKQFCTASVKGQDMCRLVSSAEICYTESSNGYETLYIIGILSRGGCIGPILNTKVTELLSWIVNETPDTNYCRK